MAIIKYGNDKKLSTRGAVLVFGMYLVIMYGGRHHPQFWEGFVLITLGYGYFIYTITKGSFGVLDTEKKLFYRVSDTFFKNKILVSNIIKIQYSSTWVVGGLGKSLFIIGTEGAEEKIIDFPNVGFTEATLARIAKDLIKLNPRIEIDEETKNLIKKL